VSYTCTTSSSFYQGVAEGTYSTDAAGASVQTDANENAFFDTSLSFPSSSFALPTGESEVSCTSDGIRVTCDS
jgi:hypothetical protein